MSSALLLSLALAAAPWPQAPQGAEVVAHVPRLDALPGALPFLQAAGSKSALLRPSAWRAGALPLLGVDVTDPGSLQAAGLDPKGALTTSRLQGATLSCFKLLDGRRFRARADEALARQGTRFQTVVQGVPVAGVKDPLDRVLAAVAVAGGSACGLSGGEGKSLQPLLPSLAEALRRPPTGPGLALAAAVPGVAQLIGPRGASPFAAGLSAAGLGATVALRAQGLGLPALQAGAAPTAYGALQAAGLAVARARFTRAAMPGVLERVAAQVPGGAAALKGLLPRLAPLLTGQAAALLGEVRVTSGLRSPPARFFALKLALAAQTSDPAAAAALLATVPPEALAVREGRVTLSVVGDSVLLANDDEVRDRLAAALARAQGPQAHALEVSLDPPRLARALGQVPLLEAVQAPELAGAVAAGTELGPLLLVSRAASLWLDPVGAGAVHQGQLSWALDPARFTEDGGVR